MIEVQVHQQLRDFLRRQAGVVPWPHQLTMARLVARSLATGRSALIQVSSRTQYRLSYLFPALAWPQSIILAVPSDQQAQLLAEDIPFLRTQFGLTKRLHCGLSWPAPDWEGVLVVDPVIFLRDRLKGGNAFPDQVPVVFDHAHNLESWVEQALAITVLPADWQHWRQKLTSRPAAQVLQLSAQIAHYILGREQPQQTLSNPLRENLGKLLDRLQPMDGPWADMAVALHQEWAVWAQVFRETGQFSLQAAPLYLGERLAQQLWGRQPVVLIGESLDAQKQAPRWRQRLGLGDLTCLQFPSDRQDEEISLYLPNHLLEPNAPFFLAQVQPLLGSLILGSPGSVVILVESWAMAQELGTTLAAQFGSRVGVGRLRAERNEVLVCPWEFWEANSENIRPPQVMVICSLPFPSLEHPLVHARVSDYKRLRQDWFKEYLLPLALGRLQRGINPLRKTRGLVALLDGRATRRSYGPQFLESLAPARRIVRLADSLPL